MVDDEGFKGRVNQGRLLSGPESPHGVYCQSRCWPVPLPLHSDALVGTPEMLNNNNSFPDTTPLPRH